MREELVFVATCDISGHVRGKGFPARELPARLRKGVGWTHSNLMMSAFGPIWDTPFGTAGDLMIVPDPAAEVRVDFDDDLAPEHFFLGDICTTDGTAWECCPRTFLRRALTDLMIVPDPAAEVRVDFDDDHAPEHFFLGDICTTDGIPWECCPRTFLRRALADLEATAGLRLVAAFEQEFVYTGATDRPGDAYALGAFRRAGDFSRTFIAALRTAGVTPDSFLAEYGPRQFEVTVAPAPALAAADQAVITREIGRATAHRLGHRVIFSPVPDPELVGNGVHIHMSLHDAAGRPVTHAPEAPLSLSQPAAHFFAGVLHHLPAICAVTAPSPVSYLRLTPNRWAPTVIDLLQQDRGASLRICPTFAAATPEESARQFNVEFRPTDASASPYLALGAIVHAGVEGLRRGLSLPDLGAAARPPLPRSLPEALDNLAKNERARDWFGPVHLDAYLRYKRAEVAHVRDLAPAELCARYAEVY